MTIQLFSAGPNWEKAYAEAQLYINRNLKTDFQIDAKHIFCLGPQVNTYAQKYLQQQIISSSEIQLGQKLFSWTDWVTQLARQQSIRENQSFQILSETAQRDFLRQILANLAKAQLLEMPEELWREEKFFLALFQCVVEFRMAGFSQASEIERLREQMQERNELLQGLGKKDLWTILLAWSESYAVMEHKLHDFCDVLQIAKVVDFAALDSVFLFGFEHFSPLEIDFIASLARAVEVFLPVSISEHNLAKAINNQESSEESSIFTSIRQLAITSNNCQLIQTEAAIDNAEFSYPLLQANTPNEEIRACANLICESIQTNSIQNWRIIVPKEYFSTASLRQNFLKQLQLDSLLGVKTETVDGFSLIQRLLQCVSMVANEFPLSDCLAFANLLVEHKKNEDFARISETALRLGIRDGLPSWELAAAESKDICLKDFIAELKLLEEAFPQKATATQYKLALEKLFEELEFPQIIKSLNDLALERITHMSFAALLNNLALLAANMDGEIDFQTWLQELFLVLKKLESNSEKVFHEKIQIFEIGDWLPPSIGSSATIVLGLTNSLQPKQANFYFVGESDRKYLSDWNLRSAMKSEFDLLLWFQTVLQTKQRVYLSRSKFTNDGKEQAEAILLQNFSTFDLNWPKVNLQQAQNYFQAKSKEVALKKFPGITLSTSLMDQWQECPFSSLGEKIWKLEDKIKEANLDASALDEGLLFHKCLEIFFEKYHGIEIKNAEKREELLQLSFQESFDSYKFEYYKGGKNLLELMKARLWGSLIRLVDREAEYFAEFPEITRSKSEVGFKSKLRGKTIEGVQIAYHLKGKIDRIDLDEKNKRALVIDYKRSSSLPPTSSILNNSKLQLPIYIMEANKLGLGEVIGAYYLSLNSPKRNQGLLQKEYNRSKKNKESSYFQLSARSGSLVDAENYQQILGSALQEAFRRADAMQRGHFPVKPEDNTKCESCAVRPVCRIREKEDYEWEQTDETEAYLKILKTTSVPKQSIQKAEIKFNEMQEKALQDSKDLVFVEASAGSGKTTIIVEKYARTIEKIISEQKIKADFAVEKILAITFTEKSAAELQKRIFEKLNNHYGARVATKAVNNINTIHGFNRKIISEYSHLIHLDPTFEVVEEVEAKFMQEAALEELFLEMDTYDYYDLFEEYSRAELHTILLQILSRRSIIEAELELIEELQDPRDNKIIGLLLSLYKNFVEIYDRKKQESVCVDFNDLERLAIKLLQSEEVKRNYKQSFDLILVDEFQDTNSIQRDLLESIAKENLSNVFVVGDAKQSIYRFRAAEVSVFQSLRKQAEKQNNLCRLNVNYRSQANIVNFTNILSEHLFPKKIEPDKEYEAPFAHSEEFKAANDAVVLYKYDAKEQSLQTAAETRAFEASEIVKLIQQLESSGKKLEDITLLFRKISGNQVFFQQLNLAGIPFVMGSGGNFYSDQIIIDGISLLRFLQSSDNFLATIAVLRSPWLEIEDSLIQKLIQENRKDFLEDLLSKKEYRFLADAIEMSKFHKASEILQYAYSLHPLYSIQTCRMQMDKLISIVESLEESTNSFFELVQKLSKISGWQSEAKAVKEGNVPDLGQVGAVKIMTVHAAKGLEFPIVILPDLDGKTPDSNAIFRFQSAKNYAIKKRDEDRNWLASQEYNSLKNEDREKDVAELKRLLYVAVTRAEHSLYCLLPKESKYKTKRACWADWIRACDFGDHALEVNALDKLNIKSLNQRPKSIEVEKNSSIANKIPLLANQLDLTISATELASYVFCSEFHRLKFVQKWEDKVVSLWPGEKNVRLDEGEEFQILQKLNLSKMERGICVHRVLERIQSYKDSSELWRIWLEEAYTSLGIENRDGLLIKLIDHDIKLVNRLLSSELGKQLFSPQVKSFAEVPFHWNIDGKSVTGVIDRVVALSDEVWIVADYKTASLEKSNNRYTFQVACYMEALRNYLQQQGIVDISISGWIVDLFSSKSWEVQSNIGWTKQILQESLISHSQRNNRKHVEKMKNLQSLGTESCISCPYTSHCAPGKQYMLNYR